MAFIERTSESEKPESENETASVMEEEFMAISEANVQGYYRHCALTRQSDCFKDLSD